tara:strand:+ start:1918 stop:2826 length:909 start_codon:yes stop_codon:yes gene_type:complete
MEDNFRDTVLFNGIGTDKVVIGHSAKMGSTSLDHFQQDNSEFIKYLKNEPYDENKIYVVLIRDIMKLWKSGYIYELLLLLENLYYHDNVTNLHGIENLWIGEPVSWEGITPLQDFATRLKNGYYLNKEIDEHDCIFKCGIEAICRLHNKWGDVSWMSNGHAIFHQHISPATIRLWELSLLPNVYFLGLEKLSNPKFLKWLQEKDRLFENVRENFIGHHGDKLSNSNISKTLDLLWEKYDDKTNFLSNYKLVRPDFSTIKSRSPIFDDETINNRFFYQYKIALEIQNMINHIKNNNLRFLNFK